MNFLIQLIPGQFHDFSFHLIEACKYHNWLGNKDITFELNETIPPPSIFHNAIEPSIPVGTVEFVCEYLKEFYNLEPKPRNVPEELFKFAGRNILNGTEKDIIGEKFVKSNDKIKVFTEICKKAPAGNYQISDIIDIQSEWRGFVYQGELVGLQNYLGEFDIFPDVACIRQMILEYKSAPVSYTLDVGISNGNTVIIEVHDFFSCGLYGFHDYKLLPFMFSRWWFEYLKGNEV